MIRINLSDYKKKKIEKDYWMWINSSCYKDIADILKKDRNFVYKYLDGRISKKSVKKFLLSSPEDLDNWAATKSCCNNDTAKKLKELYRKYRSTKAVDIFETIGINACPYCNQNSLVILRRKDGSSIFCGELDHFYSKSDYPEFSVCLYNLIPVCKVCNHIKLQKSDKITNPFSMTYENGLMFTANCFINTGSSASLLNEEKGAYAVSLFRDNMTPIDENEAEMLGIEERYSGFDEHVEEIVIKHYAYKDEYLDEISRMCKKNPDELKGYVFGYTTDHNHRALSKFNKDILDQCELFNNEE